MSLELVREELLAKTAIFLSVAKTEARRKPELSEQLVERIAKLILYSTIQSAFTTKFGRDFTDEEFRSLVEFAYGKNQAIFTVK